MAWTFNKLVTDDGSWQRLIDDWTKQCEDFGEEFEDYAVSTMPVLHELAEFPTATSGVYALYNGDNHVAACQLNTARLPKTTGVTLRTRHITVCPRYDFENVKDSELGDLMGQLFVGIYKLSNGALPSDHIKVHLRSPLEMTFFVAFTGYLKADGVVKSVDSRGAWIYLTK